MLVTFPSNSRFLKGCQAFSFSAKNRIIAPMTLTREAAGHSFAGVVDPLLSFRATNASVGAPRLPNQHSFSLLASASSSPSSSSLRKRSRSKKSKAKKGAFVRGGSGTPLSMEELAEHVSHEYVHGPGGMLRDLERKRSRLIRPPPPQQTGDQNLLLSTESNAPRSSPGDEDANNNNDDDDEDYAAAIRNLDHHPALVLNADFQPLSYLPLSMWHWQEAVKAVFNGKVTVVDVYPDVVIRAATLRIPLPSVIALTEYVSPQFLHHKPAFTKRNVFLRDEYRCQYCNDFFHTRDLTLDHVVPRSQGGHLNWENAVTCCTGCNGKKGCMGLHEIQSKWGMKLRAPPRIPSQYELAMIASRMLPRKVHPTWQPYLPQDARKKTATNLKNGSGSAAVNQQQHHTQQMQLVD
ncbi:hypothetical protein ACA910_001032 [Epithemia clementina (nom. ined.)]